MRLETTDWVVTALDNENNCAPEPAQQPDSRAVLNIYGMTTHNGPGIRTLVQFKGCPLRCLWCSTPESQKSRPELAFYPSKCIRCDKCLPVCPKNALTLKNEAIAVDRRLCDSCGACTDVCYAEALKLLGQTMTVEEVLSEVRKDKIFFRHSGGGVTLTGGEPLMNPAFAGKLLRALKAEGISAGVDTCGEVPWEDLEPLLPSVDFFLWDLKHMDPETHKKLTGVSNERILRNARAVSERNVPIYLRLPVIPGFNDSPENIRAVCVFAKSLPSLVEVDLMPVHHLGKARYESLGREYPIPSELHIPEDSLQEIRQTVQSCGIPCNIVA